MRHLALQLLHCHRTDAAKASAVPDEIIGAVSSHAQHRGRGAVLQAGAGNAAEQPQDTGLQASPIQPQASAVLCLAAQHRAMTCADSRLPQATQSSRLCINTDTHTHTAAACLPHLRLERCAVLCAPAHQQRVHRHTGWLDHNLSKLVQITGQVQRMPAIKVGYVWVSTLCQQATRAAAGNTGSCLSQQQEAPRVRRRTKQQAQQE